MSGTRTTSVSAPWRARIRAQRKLVACLLVAVTTLASLATIAPSAQAALYNPIPLNANEEPEYNFVDDDALFVYVTSDIAGGQVCVVPTDSDGCVWGQTTLVGIGSVFAPMEGPSLPPGSWRIKAVNTLGETTGMSDIFTVTACADCSRDFALARLQEWKDRALSMRTGLNLTCTAFNFKDLADEVQGARGRIKKATDRATSYERGETGFKMTVGLTLGGPMGFIPSLPDDPFTYNQNKALEILKDLSCAAGAMYNDIYNDPPDANYGAIVAPWFAELGTSDRASLNDLMAGLDRQTAYGEAALISYERFLGADIDGDHGAAAAQAKAASEYSFSQVAQMRATSAALRRYATDLATQAPFNAATVQPEPWTRVQAAYNRVATSGFLPEEITEMEAAGLTATQIADLRTHFDVPITGFDPARSLVAYIRSLADETDAAIDAVDAFAREAAAISARRALLVPNTPPTAAFTATPDSGPAPLDVTFTSTSSDSDGSITTYRWSYGDGVVETGPVSQVQHTYATPGTYTATLTVTDNRGATASTTRTVVATGPAVNTPPVANAQALTTSMNTHVEITLTGTDPDGDPLTFAIATPPAGTLTGTGATRTYQPPANQVGTDVFTFTVNDGKTTSQPAPVTINIQPPGSTNQPPVATAQALTTSMNTPIEIVLAGTDPDGDPLTFAIATPPAGTLTGTGATRTYQPPANQVGTDVFTFTVNDGQATSQPAPVTITIQPPDSTNQPPVAIPQTLATTMNTSIEIVLAGTDADGDPLTFAITDPPRGSLSGTGSVRTYRPPTGQIGTDAFQFTVSDGKATSIAATVTITIGQAPDTNQPPVITSTATSVTVAEGSSVSPQRSVTDPDGVVVSQVWSSSEGYSGTALPRFDDDGTYTVTLTATDNWGATTSRTWPVTVTNALPNVSGNVAGRWRAGIPRPMQVSVTDPGPLDTHTVSWDFGDGATATGLAVSHTWAANGTYTVRVTATDDDGGTRTATYQVRIVDFVVDAGPPATGPDGAPILFNFNGSTARDAYTTYVVDWGDGTPLQTITTLSPTHVYAVGGQYTVTLTGSDAIPGGEVIVLTDTTTAIANRPPATQPDIATTPANVPVVLSVLGNDTDPNGNSITVTGASTPANGTVTCATDGTCTYTPTPGFRGVDDFTYSATDSFGATSPGRAVVAVGMNLQVSADIVWAIDESGSMASAFNQIKANTSTISALIQSVGLDGRYGLVGYGSGGAGGRPAVRPSVITPISTAEVFRAGLDLLVDNGGTEPAWEAVAKATSDEMGFRQGAGVCVVLVTDEFTNGDQITQADALAALEARGATLFTIGPSGAQDPTRGLVAATGGTTFSIVDFRDNPVPVLTQLLQSCAGSIVEGISLDPPATTTDVGTDVTLTATVTDSSALPVPGQEVTFEVTEGPNTGQVGTATTAADGTATFTFASLLPGTDVITASFTDSVTGDRRTDTATITWVPLPPGELVAVDDEATTDEDTPVTIDVTANDQNPDGDILQVAVATAPANGSATVVDGKIEYQPAPGFHGTDSFTYSITDGTSSATATVTVVVGPLNDPPTIDPIDDLSMPEGTTRTITVTATDPDGDLLTITSPDLPAFATLTDHGDGTATITFTPPLGSAGTSLLFSVTVTDPAGSSATAQATVTVTGTNEAPTAQDSQHTTPFETPVGITLTASDPDGDLLTYEILEQPASGLLVGAGQNLVYVPNDGFTGVDTFTYQASDGVLSSNVATVTVVVLDPSAPPPVRPPIRPIPPWAPPLPTPEPPAPEPTAPPTTQPPPTTLPPAPVVTPPPPPTTVTPPAPPAPPAPTGPPPTPPQPTTPPTPGRHPADAGSQPPNGVPQRELARTGNSGSRLALLGTALGLAGLALSIVGSRLRRGLTASR